MNTIKRARIIALYLPQYHPIPENDEWWGKGFTEWTNVGRAKPLFRGHHQPRVPADLGYYDLRLPEVREQQAQLAREAGIEGFCYYHYWFGNGKQLLERPFNEVLNSGKPDFPFCLCWANHTWSNSTWEKKTRRTQSTVLIEQKYQGIDDYVQHFESVLPAFKDKRYIHIDGKPVFVIYDPRFKEVSTFIETWRRLATEKGLLGIYFIGMTHSTIAIRTLPSGETIKVLPNLISSADIFQEILDLGFDAVNSFGKRRGEMLRSGKYWDLFKTIVRRYTGLSLDRGYDYAKTVRGYFAPEDMWENVYPTIMPQWDRTPRAGNIEGVYVNATPEAFAEHVRHALKYVENRTPEHRILFLKSWNEWGEGNYMEPDLDNGKGFIDALRQVIVESSTQK